MKDFLNAFPEALRAEAEKPADLLATQLRLMDHPAEERHRHVFEIRLGSETVSIPLRLYDRNSSFKHHADLAAKNALTPKQSLIYFCLLSRHCNGFIREDALCRIASAPEPFVVPFVTELAGEYVYEILLQIWLRLDQFDRGIYGQVFRDNPAYLARQRQRIISYWNCYYRWDDYTGVDGGVHRKWQDPYPGFAVFDAFKSMAETPS